MLALRRPLLPWFWDILERASNLHVNPTKAIPHWRHHDLLYSIFQCLHLLYTSHSCWKWPYTPPYSRSNPFCSPIAYAYLSFLATPLWTFHFLLWWLVIISSITLSTTIPRRTTPSCYIQSQLGVSPQYLSTLSVTYLLFTVAYTYNRLELQYQLLYPKPTGTYTYNNSVLSSTVCCTINMYHHCHHDHSPLPPVPYLSFFLSSTPFPSKLSHSPRIQDASTLSTMPSIGLLPMIGKCHSVCFSFHVYSEK